jgi:hypothetical protein
VLLPGQVLLLVLLPVLLLPQVLLLVMLPVLLLPPVLLLVSLLAYLPEQRDQPYILSH